VPRAVAIVGRGDVTRSYGALIMLLMRRYAAADAIICLISRAIEDADGALRQLTASAVTR